MNQTRFPSEKVIGNVSFGIGEKDEPYEGIGRGELNIENIPVFRDKVGAFGTPTSDSVRTSVSLVSLLIRSSWFIKSLAKISVTLLFMCFFITIGIKIIYIVD